MHRPRPDAHVPSRVPGPRSPKAGPDRASSASGRSGACRKACSEDWLGRSPGWPRLLATGEGTRARSGAGPDPTSHRRAPPVASNRGHPKRSLFLRSGVARRDDGSFKDSEIIVGFRPDSNIRGDEGGTRRPCGRDGGPRIVRTMLVGIANRLRPWTRLSPRSDAPRRNPVPDAPRHPSVSQATRSVEDGFPTREHGNEFGLRVDFIGARRPSCRPSRRTPHPPPPSWPSRLRRRPSLARSRVRSGVCGSRSAPSASQ